MKQVITIILFAIALNAFGQDWPVKKAVSDKKAAGVSFVQIPAFSYAANKPLEGRGTYQELTLHAGFKARIMQQRPGALKLTIPINGTESITCELVKFDLGNAKITENNKDVIEGVTIPVLYHGIVTSEQQKHNVILTVNDTYISLIATFNNRALQITQAGEVNPLTYRLYNSTTVQFPATALDCGTKDKGGPSQTSNGIQLNGTYNRTNAVQDKCVNVFVECFDSLYLWRGSNEQQTINYVYELFNLVTTGYLNDTINVQVMGINVWTVTDPYRNNTRQNALDDLSAYYKDNFWGNICVGLDYTTNGQGGLAGGFGVAKAMAPNACPSYQGSVNEFCYCDQNFSGTFLGFPTGPNTTQGQLELVMHEMGHLLGSRHTHWCGWQLAPGVVGAIDSCATVENGPCANVGTTPPTAGGSIMSYCHLSAAGSYIWYNNGFGPLPGNTIRNFVDHQSCIQSCMACLIQNKSRMKDDWAVQTKPPTAAGKNESPPPPPVPLLNADSKDIYLKQTANNTIQLNR